MSLSKEEVLNILDQNKVRFRELGVARIGVFGSYAKGSQSSDSDVDLLVEFIPDEKTYRNFIKIYDLSEELLGKGVDLVTPEALDSFILTEINKNIIYV